MSYDPDDYVMSMPQVRTVVAAVEEAEKQLAWWQDQPNVAFAAECGAANFTPAMLPDLWLKSTCPYATPIYRQAWKRGLYYAAAWWLLDALIEVTHTTKPDMVKIAERWIKNNPNCGWEVVTPGAAPTEGR